VETRLIETEGVKAVAEPTRARIATVFMVGYVFGSDFGFANL
jgi:hypothetical protein